MLKRGNVCHSHYSFFFSLSLEILFNMCVHVFTYTHAHLTQARTRRHTRKCRWQETKTYLNSIWLKLDRDELEIEKKKYGSRPSTQSRCQTKPHRFIKFIETIKKKPTKEIWRLLHRIGVRLFDWREKKKKTSIMDFVISYKRINSHLRFNQTLWILSNRSWHL